MERMRRVGAQRPTKMPKRSAWAVASGVVRSRKNQMPMERRMEKTPAMKQKEERERKMWGFMAGVGWGRASRAATPELCMGGRGLAWSGEERAGRAMVWARVRCSTLRPIADIPPGMKLPAFPSTLLAVCALLFSQTTRADDVKAMEGTWKVESAEAGGKPLESADLMAVVLKITGLRYEVTIKDKLDGGTLALDEKQMPKTLDATDTEGDDVGKVVKAIYELTGDTLKVAYTLDGGERPKEFATKEGSPVLLVTYKREKKAE